MRKKKVYSSLKTNVKILLITVIILLIFSVFIFLRHVLESSTNKNAVNNSGINAVNNSGINANDEFLLTNDNYIDEGASYLEMGEYDKAEMIFKYRIDNNSTNVLDYILLVRTYAKEEKYEEALGVAEKIINMNPKSNFSLFVLGAIYNGMGNYAAAENAFNKSLMISPNLSILHSGLGWTYLHRREYLKAEMEFKTAIENENIKTSYTHTGIGWAYLYLGEYDSAEIEFKKAIILKQLKVISPSVNISMSPENGIVMLHSIRS